MVVREKKKKRKEQRKKKNQTPHSAFPNQNQRPLRLPSPLTHNNQTPPSLLVHAHPQPLALAVGDAGEELLLPLAGAVLHGLKPVGNGQVAELALVGADDARGCRAVGQVQPARCLAEEGKRRCGPVRRARGESGEGGGVGGLARGGKGQVGGGF